MKKLLTESNPVNSWAVHKSIISEIIQRDFYLYFGILIGKIPIYIDCHLRGKFSEIRDVPSQTLILRLDEVLKL